MYPCVPCFLRCSIPSAAASGARAVFAGGPFLVRAEESLGSPSVLLQNRTFLGFGFFPRTAVMYRCG